MRDENNAVWGVLFLIFLVALAVGGFFLTRYMTQDKEEDTNEVQEEILSDEYKINKNLDYIYFENEKFISVEPDITYKDVVINLNTAETINSTLKSELEVIRNSVKYISDNKLDPNRETLYEEENIYSASERNYETYDYKEYISLIVKDYEFNCYDGSLLKSLKSYVFNISNGKLLLTNELLDLYEIDMDGLKNKVRDQLQKNQKIDNEVELIKIEETISNLDDTSTYALYIDKYGDLNISYIVKTTQVDYNEIMKLN